MPVTPASSARMDRLASASVIHRNVGVREQAGHKFSTPRSGLFVLCSALLGGNSIHWIAVLCLIWHFLYGVPVLNDLSFRIEPERVHRYVFFIAWPSHKFLPAH